MNKGSHWRRGVAPALVFALAAVVWPLITLGQRGTAPDDVATRGAELFSRKFTTEQGLGPLFNQNSCAGCHAYPSVGGMGSAGLGTVTRIGRLTSAGFDSLAGRGGPIARAHSVTEDGLACDLEAGIPRSANMTSVRNAPDLHGAGLIDAIPDEEIAAGAVARGDGVHGRPHKVKTADGRERIGRFGWKADTASLYQFVGEAFRNELGITNPVAPADLLPSDMPVRHACPGEGANPEAGSALVEAVTAFVGALPPYQAQDGPPHGAVLFGRAGCDACHTPSLLSGRQRIWLYSDLLLHDMGPDLDDGVLQGQASGHDWRTTPLWGLGKRERFLHDARARSLTEAIQAHGGEAAAARQRFRQLSSEEREALLAFLSRL
jgi:CxxC motif-containing protein (DUF1111 family)